MIEVATPQKAVLRVKEGVCAPFGAQLAANACRSAAANDGNAAVRSQSVGIEPFSRSVWTRCE